MSAVVFGLILLVCGITAVRAASLVPGHRPCSCSQTDAISGSL